MKCIAALRMAAAAGIALVLAVLPAQAQRIEDARPVGSLMQATALASLAETSAPAPLSMASAARGESQWKRYALIGAVVGAALVVAPVVYWCAVKTQIGCENDDTVIPFLTLAVPAAVLAGGELGALIGAQIPAPGVER